MEKLIQIVANSFDLPIGKIKGRKRYCREVSYAKMIFCLLAYNEYRIMHRAISRFLECPRTNVYHLLSSARNNLEYDKQFREKYESVKGVMSDE